METKKKLLLFLAVEIVVMAIVFSYSGFFNDRIDTSVYVSQINSFSGATPVGMQDQAAMFRFFKPLYGILGAGLTHFTSPYGAILFLNILAYLGFAWVVYMFLKGLGFEESQSMIGTIWTITAYPVLKYGLALGTDMSGWFFATAVVAIFLTGMKKNNLWFIVLSSIVGIVGSLTKETAVMGLIVAGLSILLSFGMEPAKLVWKKLIALCAPFFILEGIFLKVIFALGAPSFLSWYAFNKAGYAPDYYKLSYFLGVEGSTFSILLILMCVGIYFAIRDKDILKQSWMRTFFPLFVASLPVLMWPIFISRVVFIQFLFVIPISLYALSKLPASYRMKIAILVPVASLVLFLVSGNGSLFTLIEKVVSR